ncbi:Protein FLX-like 1, partial [Mucuna pruriens]
MAGRKHAPSSLTRLDETRLAHSSSVRALEDRIDARHRDIQILVADNKRLAGIHVALKQDLAVTQEELRRLSAAAAEVKADRDAEVREIYEKSLKVDAEVRAVAAMSSELDRVRADAQELAAARKELASQLQAVESDLARVRAEAQFVPAMKADIEAMRHEIQRGRNAIEFEKKTHASNLEHRLSMDNNMIIMAREVEKLRAELANAEKRARAEMAAAAKPSPGYPANYDNPEMGYGGITYPPDSYSMHQIQAGVGTHSPYAAGAPLHQSNDLQHSQVKTYVENTT